MVRLIISTIMMASALLGASQVVAQGENTVTYSAYEEALKSWGLVLDEYVDDSGRTDFIALAKDPRDLRHFVDFVGSASPASQPGIFDTSEKVLAYHINAYNALAMIGVIDEGIPGDFDSFFKRARFFRFRSVQVGGKETSLQTYENEVIRPLGDPRAHFALNCMVRDCPRLPRVPFRADSLEQQLDLATQDFFSKERNLRIDHKKRTIYVSSILDFYTKDFVDSGKARDLPRYINRYLENPLPDQFKVKFIKYDWTINQRPDV